MDHALETLAAGARDALGRAGTPRGAVDDAAARFELFHGANSICSQKVRAVLAHHRLPYVSHAMNMFGGETYLPGYVRLRMTGCERFGGPLVSHHSGSTSAGAGGCDGAVVPTLIDWRTRDVLVDSKRICLYLDEQAPPADTLRPAPLAAAIDEQLGIVDNLPNYQMLMGRAGAVSESPATKGSTGGRFSGRKVEWCDRYLREHAGDPTLVAAYGAKRAKETSAANALFSPEAMLAAYSKADAALHDLERALGRRDGAWLLGRAVTMADLFWAVELLRVKNLGLAKYWDGGRLPEVERYAAGVEALPAVREAVLDWPDAQF